MKIYIVFAYSLTDIPFVGLFKEKVIKFITDIEDHAYEKAGRLQNDDKSHDYAVEVYEMECSRPA